MMCKNIDAYLFQRRHRFTKLATFVLIDTIGFASTASLTIVNACGWNGFVCVQEWDWLV